MSEIKVNSIVDASGGNTTTINGVAPNVNNIRGKNKIINGDMRVDQRNATTTVNTTNEYTVDRWTGYAVGGGQFTAQQSTDAPDGFSNSLLLTVTTTDTPAAGDYFLIQQAIEGNNLADMDFGTSSAKTFILSFWVKSSVTGTYGGSFYSDANDSYVFEYTISSANTWEYKTVTVAGDTAGTWSTDNTLGMKVSFALGAGSTYEATAGSWSTATLHMSSSGATDWIANSGATFYITGVQLEAGDTASGFEHLSYGETLAMCQRYYCKSYDVGTAPATSTLVGVDIWSGSTDNSGMQYVTLNWPIPMRAGPTVSIWSNTGATGVWVASRNGFSTTTATVNVNNAGTKSCYLNVAVTGSWLVSQVYGHWTADAEL